MKKIENDGKKLPTKTMKNDPFAVFSYGEKKDN